MKSLIVYSSRANSAKPLAQAVYETLPGHKDIYAVADAPDANDYDFIAVGFCLQGGKPDPIISEYLSKLSCLKRLFLFATDCTATELDHKIAMDHAKSLVPNAEAIDTPQDRKQISIKVLDKIKAKLSSQIRLTDPYDAADHYDDIDIDQIKHAVNMFYQYHSKRNKESLACLRHYFILL